MRVLITGHCGYIGILLVPLLRQAGHEPAGLDTDLFAGCDFPGFDWQRLGGEAQAETLAVETLDTDLRDVTPAQLEGFDAVAHLAGLSNDPLGNLNANLTYDINLDASVHLARCAKQAGIERFVFSSSCSNYGAAGDDFLDETSTLNPVTPYAKSKVKVEQELSALADDSFSPVYLRNATAYGSSPRLRLDLVLNNLVAWALTTGVVKLLSDGTPWRPVVHAEDICRAFVAVLEAPRERIHDQAFNVGRQDENYRIRELAEIVRDTVPGSRIEIAEGAGPDTRCYRVDCTKIARQLPEFQPQWDARRGAVELYEAYQRAGLTLADLEGSRYIRLEHIRRRLDAGTLDTNLRPAVP